MDQLAEYRSRQKQRFAAERLKRESSEAPDEKESRSDNPERAVLDVVPSTRPCAPLELGGEVGSETRASGSCPGTPREYRQRHQERFALERARLNLEDSQSAPAESVSLATEASQVSPENTDASSGYTHTSPPTPRQRGSASLRAISAARALRLEEATPLPGAAWPGHLQNSSETSGVSRRSLALPPRPPTPSTPSNNSAPKSSQTSNSMALPPRAPTVSRTGRRSLSTCAAELRNSSRSLAPSVLCC